MALSKAARHICAYSLSSFLKLSGNFFSFLNISRLLMQSCVMICRANRLSGATDAYWLSCFLMNFFSLSSDQCQVGVHSNYVDQSSRRDFRDCSFNWLNINEKNNLFIIWIMKTDKRRTKDTEMFLCTLHDCNWQEAKENIESNFSVYTHNREQVTLFETLSFNETMLKDSFSWHERKFLSIERTSQVKCCENLKCLIRLESCAAIGTLKHLQDRERDWQFLSFQKYYLTVCETRQSTICRLQIYLAV